MKIESDYCRYTDACYSVSGEGEASPADIDDRTLNWVREGKRRLSLILKDGVTGLRGGFLECFPSLSDVRFSDSVSHVAVSDAARELLRKNAVVIRGKFGSYAESFAREHSLTFMHADIHITHSGDYFEHGVDSLDLLFRRDGTAVLFENSCCQGISAGCNGGCDHSIELSRDFYRTMSLEKIADECWGCFRGAIMRSKALKEFLDGAKARNGYVLR